MVPLVAFLVVWVALGVVWISAIVSTTRFSAGTYEAAGRSRPLTIALVVITGWLGAAYYWLVIKRELTPPR